MPTAGSDLEDLRVARTLNTVATAGEPAEQLLTAWYGASSGQSTDWCSAIPWTARGISSSVRDYTAQAIRNVADLLDHRIQHAVALDRSLEADRDAYEAGALVFFGSGERLYDFSGRSLADARETISRGKLQPKWSDPEPAPCVEIDGLFRPTTIVSYGLRYYGAKGPGGRC